MTVGMRWLAIILLGLGCWNMSLHAEEHAPAPEKTNKPSAITEDASRLLELGKLLMGQNNPVYSGTPMKNCADARNAAGEQALSTFRTVVKLYPQFAEGWLWLGIALTETLYYSKDEPQGRSTLTEEKSAEGVQAFRCAYDRAPANITYVKYFGDALMTYKHDFEGARKLWAAFLPTAVTDLQRVVALVQSARASLNKAYFGKDAKMSPGEIAQNFHAAENNVMLAAKLCPNARDVKEMQILLQQYRKILYGK